MPAGLIISGHIAAALTAYAESQGRNVTQQDVESSTWAMIQNGNKITAAEMAGAVTQMHKAGRVVGAFLQEYDLLLGATLPNPPVPLGYLNMNDEDLGPLR